MINLSDISSGLIGQPMFKLLEKTKELERSGEKIIHFEIGDPDFSTPKNVVEAAIKSLKAGETHYVESVGLFDLREEICRFTSSEMGFLPDMDQVLVIPANAVIDYVVRCVADPGDEVILPDPGFPTYFSVANYTGVKPVSIPLRESNGFVMDPEEIKKKISPRTRLLILNSPHNPTGAVCEREIVDEIAKICLENNIFLLSDEVYSKLVYSGNHCSPSTNDHCSKMTITLNSFSKNFAMSGWRLGYAIGPVSLIEKMALLLQTTISCLPVFIQRGGIEALRGNQSILAERRLLLQERRDALVEGLNQISGIRCRMPGGAFYAFPNIEQTGLTSISFAERLLENQRICVLDGDCFGRSGAGFVRFSYASTSLELIKESLDRINEFVNSL